MSRPRIKYEVIADDGTVEQVKKGEVVTRLGQKFLRYELADGTIGLKRPGTWRKKEELKDAIL
jgi:hypothetical protein